MAVELDDQVRPLERPPRRLRLDLAGLAGGFGRNWTQGTARRHRAEVQGARTVQVDHVDDRLLDRARAGQKAVVGQDQRPL